MGDYFTLGFTNFNMIVSIAMIVLTVWFITVNYSKFLENLRLELMAKFSRLFDGPNRQPLYDVFYGLNHSSTEQWVRWIKTQTAKKQDRAFRRLAEYLEEPPKELGLITKEVVKAVKLFEHPNSYGVLLELMTNTRAEWGKYKVLHQFYEDAGLGLMHIDSEQAETFLRQELSKVKHNPDEDSFKSSIIAILSTIEDENRLIVIFKEIILDTSHSLNIRMQALGKVEGIGEKVFIDLLHQVIESIINNKQVKDYLMFETCFLRLVENIDDDDDYNWDLVFRCLVSLDFAILAAEILALKIGVPDFMISNKRLFNIMQITKDQPANLLSHVLKKRFLLSLEEQVIVDTADKVAYLYKHELLPDKVLSLDENIEKMSVPDFLMDAYKKTDELLSSKTLMTGMRLITGAMETEKYFLVRAVAANLKLPVIFVDIPKLLMSPDKIDEIDILINKNRPCILFLSNCVPLIQAMDDTTNKRVVKFWSIIKKLINDSRIKIIATIAVDAIDLRDSSPELFEQIKVLPNNIFSSKINVDKYTAKQKQKIFNHYELSIRDDRESGLEGFEDILDITEDYSNIKFLNYLLDYMKFSLLTHGKLMPLDEYTEFMQLGQSKQLELV